MIKNYSFTFLDNEKIEILNTQPNFTNSHAYGSLSWAWAKNDFKNKSFLLNITGDENKSFSVNGVIIKRKFVKLIYIQSGILFTGNTPQVNTYISVLNLMKEILRNNIRGILIIRYEPIYISNDAELEALRRTKFINSKIKNISGYTRFVVDPNMNKKIKKEINRVKNSELLITKNVPLQKKDINEIINLHKEMTRNKVLPFDRWMTTESLKRLIKLFKENINVVKAYKGEILLGYSLWLDTKQNSIYFRGATSKYCGSIGVGYSLIQKKIESFLINNNHPKFIDLGGIGKTKSTKGVDQFKERFNSFEAKYIGAYEFTFSMLGRLILNILYTVRLFKNAKFILKILKSN